MSQSHPILPALVAGILVLAKAAAKAVLHVCVRPHVIPSYANRGYNADEFLLTSLVVAEAAAKAYRMCVSGHMWYPRMPIMPMKFCFF